MTKAIGALAAIVTILLMAVAVLLRERGRTNRVVRLLQESEERYRLIVNRAPVILWTARPDTTLDFVNDTCVEFMGLPHAKLCDEGWLDYVHPDDRDYCIGVYTPAFEARQPFLLEYRIKNATGTYRWLLAVGVPKFDKGGNFTGYIGCDLEITERREAEDRVREARALLEASHHDIQHLAGRLIEAQDAERARVARDLHDDVSQQLAGLSIAFSGLRQRLTAEHVGNDLQAELRDLQERTAALAKNVRHLSHDLHPTVLRHAGLVAALTSYCADLTRTHGTSLHCTAEGDFETLSEQAALCLYRVAQEALRNVVAHAKASEANVRLLRTADAAELSIVDNGVGFEAADASKHGKGLGLLSIAERVRLAQGVVTIAAEPSRGTRVTVRLPVSPRLAAEPRQVAEPVEGSRPLVSPTLEEIVDA